MKLTAAIILAYLCSSCSSLSQLQAEQASARKSGIAVKFVTVYVALGKDDCGGNGRQFEYTSEETERIPPDPINAEYPFK